MIENPSKDSFNGAVSDINLASNGAVSRSNFALDSDYRIIVLFRDPRAIINSIRNSPDAWQQGDFFIASISVDDCSLYCLRYKKEYWGSLVVEWSKWKTGYHFIWESGDIYANLKYAPTCRIQISPVLERTYRNSKTW